MRGRRFINQFRCSRSRIYGGVGQPIDSLGDKPLKDMGTGAGAGGKRLLLVWRTDSCEGREGRKQGWMERGSD